MTHEQIGRGQIEREADLVARMLDSGDDRGAAERLRQDLHSYGAKEFQNIVKTVAQFEDRNYGANLVTQRTYDSHNGESNIVKIVSGNDRYYQDDQFFRDDRYRDQFRDQFAPDRYRHRQRETLVAEYGATVTPVRGPRSYEYLPAHIAASLMDRGDVRYVAAGLRAQADQGSDSEFRRLLNEINYYDRKGQGADLALRREPVYTWQMDGRERYRLSLIINDRRDPYYGQEEHLADLTYWARPAQQYWDRPRRW